MSKARLTEIGPRGMFGAIGASFIVRKDNMFPRAAMRAMNVRLFDPSLFMLGVIKKRRIYGLLLKQW